MKVKENEEVINKLIERKTLKDLIPLYLISNVWTKEEVTFAKRLVNIRNGVAHRNLKLLEKHLGVNNNEKYFNVDYDDLRFTEKECIETMAKALNLCITLYKSKRNKYDR